LLPQRLTLKLQRHKRMTLKLLPKCLKYKLLPKRKSLKLLLPNRMSLKLKLQQPNTMR